MEAIPEEVVKQLASINEEVQILDDEYSERAKKVNVEFREKIEPLVQERQKHIDGVEGFWSDVLGGVSSPLAPLLNGTIDPKILRAVSFFNVETSVHDGDYYRKVTLKFRPNVYTDSTEVHRELSSQLETTSMSKISWKPGTDTARKDSVFRFFSDDFRIEEIGETLEALDKCFLSPLMGLEN